jgi:hypothetical protein
MQRKPQTTVPPYKARRVEKLRLERIRAWMRGRPTFWQMYQEGLSAAADQNPLQARFAEPLQLFAVPRSALGIELRSSPAVASAGLDLAAVLHASGSRGAA